MGDSLGLTVLTIRAHLLGLLVLVALPATAHATRVAGELRCEDCQGATLEVLDADLARLFVVSFDAVGPFELDVPEAFGPVALFAFRDGDGDHLPDLGADRVAAAENPMDLGAGPVTGVVLDLGARPPTPTVEVSGAVSCLDCTAVAVRLASDAGGALATLALAAPGTFAFEVPAGLGGVSISAFRDGDGDGRPDGSTTAVSQGPFTIADADVTGIALTLPPIAPPIIRLSGVVTCPSCAALPGSSPPVVVELVDGPTFDAGPVVARARLDAPGPWNLDVPEGFGPVALRAFVDVDRDLRPDRESAPVIYAAPITVTDADIASLDFALDVDLAPVVTLSGTLACTGDCAGLALALFSGPLDSADRLVAFPSEPGPWAVDVPADSGTIEVYAFFDRDGDLAPDLGTSPVAAARNPIAVGAVDESGIDLSLAGPVTDTVAIRGSLTCGGCAAPLALRMSADGRPLVVVARAPGAFELRAPKGFGPVTLSAFYDVDDDRRPDPGTVERTASPDPIVVATADVEGVTIALDPPSGTTTVVLSGTIDCAGCGAPLVLAAYEGPSTTSGPTLFARTLEEGPFALEVPQGAGTIALAGFIDEDGDRLPDLGTEVGPCDQNPLVVGATSKSGLTIRVPAPVAAPRVTLSGSVVCSGCAGAALSLAQGAGGAGPLVRLPLAPSASGAFHFEVPAGLGEVFLFGFRDDDGDLAPDPGFELVAARDNPIVVGTGDIGGLLVDLDAAVVVEPQPETVEGVEAVDAEGPDEVEAVELVELVEPADDGDAETVTPADESPVEGTSDASAESTPDASPVVQSDVSGCSCQGGAAGDPLLALMLSLWLLSLQRLAREERAP